MKRTEESKSEENKKEARAYYSEALKLLNKSKLPYLLGGGIALRQYTGIKRDMKDLDIFCKASDCPKILELFAENGYETEFTDARWLAKAYKNEHYIDFIFSNASNLCPIDDTWFEHAIKCELFGIKTRIIAPEELFWSKIYVQSRERYDGADLNHIILKSGKDLDWNRLWVRLQQHWQLLLSALLNFMFVYPSERDNVPKWLFEELLDRARMQYNLPAPVEKVCRGPLLDHTQYGHDITDWHYRALTINSI